MTTAYEASNTYTDAALLALYREALARIAVSGQSYTIKGRTFSMANLKEIREQIAWLESRVATASEGPVQNVARLKRPA